jgi:Ca-activated chloride channel family protein
MLSRKIILMVCVMLISVYANAQNITITGNVSDKTGALVGATVLVQGTETVTSTDLDGNYSIQAPAMQRFHFRL